MFKSEVERVTHALAPLCEPLHEAFAWAGVMRRQRLRELAGKQEYEWLSAHFVRAYAHFKLGGIDLGGWNLSGRHGQNGPLWLKDGGYRVRVLHALHEDQIPPPGSNFERRAFYWNPPLPLPELVDFPNDQLLVLWSIDEESQSPSFRVVRPVGSWSFGAAAKKDLDFILPQAADDLEGLQFEPNDDDLTLDIPNEDEEGTDDVGGVTS